MPTPWLPPELLEALHGVTVDELAEVRGTPSHQCESLGPRIPVLL